MMETFYFLKVNKEFGQNKYADKKTQAHTYSKFPELSHILFLTNLMGFINTFSSFILGNLLPFTHYRVPALD